MNWTLWEGDRDPCETQVAFNIYVYIYIYLFPQINHVNIFYQSLNRRDYFNVIPKSYGLN